MDVVEWVKIIYVAGGVVVGAVTFLVYMRFKLDAGSKDIQVIKAEVHENHEDLNTVKRMLEEKVSWEAARITFVSIEKHDGLKELISEKFDHMEKLLRMGILEKEKR